MKILDEIMALDRAGTPVAYRDLLPVAEAVQELEDALSRVERADTAKSRYIQQLRGEVGDLRQRHAALLDPLVQAQMLAPTPTVCIPFPRVGHLAQAFEAWETAYRADVDANFLTTEECAQLGVSELSATRAAYFHTLLSKVLL